MLILIRSLLGFVLFAPVFLHSAALHAAPQEPDAAQPGARERVWLDLALQPVDAEHATYFSWLPFPPVDAEDKEMPTRYELRLHHLNGELAMESLYTRPDHSGFVDGPYRHYNEEGALTAEGTRLRGQLHGRQRHYFSDGTLRREQHYQHGRLHGRQRAFHANGQLEYEAQREDGTLTNGTYETYDEEGRLTRRYSYLNGKLHGKDERYIDGQLRRSTPYEHGNREGIVTLYHENGALQERYVLRDGQRRGEAKRWDADGTLRSLRRPHDDGTLAYEARYYSDGTPQNMTRVLRFRNDTRLTIDTHYNETGEPVRHHARHRDAGETQLAQVRWQRTSNGGHSVQLELLTPHEDTLSALRIRESQDAEGNVIHWVSEVRKADATRWQRHGPQREITLQGGFQETHYHYGQEHGAYRFVDKQGDTLTEGEHRYGKRHGPWREDSGFNGGSAYYTYDDGVRDGAFRIEDDEGRVMEQGHYAGGDYHGELTRFDDDGEAVARLPYRHGQLHGDAFEIDRSGDHLRARFRNGQRHGNYLKTQAAGYPLEIGQYHEGQPQGRHYLFNREGRLISTRDY